MRPVPVVVAVAASLLVAGCGGDDASPERAGSANEAAIEQAEAEAVGEDEVAAMLERELGAQPDEYGIGLDYDAPGAADPCSVVVILTSPEEVTLYRGDPPDPEQPVVTNPAGTVGVKVSATARDKAACLRAAAGALKGL